MASTPSCAVTAPDEASAHQLALACSSTVEVLDARTPWNTLVAQPDGTMRLDISSTAVRTDADGEWAQVDNAVERTADGLEIASPVTPMTFSDGSGDAPLATIDRDGHTLTFDVPFDLPAPTVDGDQITYLSVIPDVDLIVTVNDDATGFSEVLRVNSPDAAADPRLDQLRFPVAVSPDLTLAAAKGGFEARDRDGAMVFTSPVPQMWDSATPVPSAGPLRPDAQRSLLSAPLLSSEQAELADLTADEDPAVAPTIGANEAVLPATVTGGRVVIEPDAGMMSSLSTVWPVYIDPSINGSLNQWTAVRDIYGPDYAFSPDEGVGICNVASLGCTKTFRSRLLWQFAGLQTLGNLDRADVLSATFSAFGSHSYSCTPEPITLYQVADFSSGTGWPGGGLWNPLDTETVAHKASCGNQRWIGFNAIGEAQAVADAGTSMASMGMAANEGSMAYWKRYQSGAAFSITYDRTPNVPTSLYIASPVAACGAVINTGLPILSAVMSDPDGDNVNGFFHIDNLRTGGVQEMTLPLQASGSTFRAQPVSVLQDDYYQFYAKPGDGVRWGPQSGGCTFTVDTTPPSVAPGASPVAGQAASYAENTSAGGVGKTGLFTFTNGGIADVTYYRYGFDDAGMTSTATLGVQVPYTPTKAGPHVLYIQSVDRAGNASPRKDYWFSVAVAPSSGLWNFDDPATSPTAADIAGSHPLTLSSTGLKGLGVVAELDPPSAAPGDGSLHFQTAADQAVSTVPVVSTSSTFSVGAFVKLDDLTGTQTAVSQDGVNASGFELGYRSGSGSGCPTSDGCWAFAMNAADSSTAPAVTTVTSSQTVVAGQWAYLTGVYDATAHAVSLSVCAPPGNGPDAAVSAPFTASWFATGALAVGRGQAGAAAAHPLRGYVDDVRVTTGVPDTTAITRYCTGITTP